MTHCASHAPQGCFAPRKTLPITGLTWPHRFRPVPLPAVFPASEAATTPATHLLCSRERTKECPGAPSFLKNTASELQLALEDQAVGFHVILCKQLLHHSCSHVGTLKESLWSCPTTKTLCPLVSKPFETNKSAQTHIYSYIRRQVDDLILLRQKASFQACTCGQATSNNVKQRQATSSNISRMKPHEAT